MMLEIQFDSHKVKEPIISKASLETNSLINIIRANVGAREGEMVVEVEKSKVEDVIKAFERQGIDVTRLEKKINKDDSCIHCGACISICPVEVFYLDDENKVMAETEKCIHCGVCVNVCPVNALHLP
ncbi:MAG: 4Fe-4S binding protein [Archaeoglobaceae archaeon]